MSLLSLSLITIIIPDLINKVKDHCIFKKPYKIIDLTHELNSHVPVWGGECGFSAETEIDYNDSTAELQFRVQQVKMKAGVGTHIDAPAHCISGGATVEQLPLEDLIIPYLMIDISQFVDEEYKLCIQDIKNFENIYGEIPAESFIIIRTGWDQFWDHPEKYINNYVFPTVSFEAAEYLVEKGIKGLGIDTLSPDKPDSGYPVHQILLSRGKYIVENIANSNLLKPEGGYIFIIPIKIKNGTEAPVRLFALIPN